MNCAHKLNYNHNKRNNMPLSCSCDFDYEFEPGDWYYMGDSCDFIELNTTRRQRCQSCKELISIGEFCVSFERLRYPYNDIEAKIYGFFDAEDAMLNEASIRIADHYICEKCGEIYLNLGSVGFDCISPRENMPGLLRDYQVEYAPPKLVI